MATNAMLSLFSMLLKKKKKKKKNKKKKQKEKGKTMLADTTSSIIHSVKTKPKVMSHTVSQCSSM